MQNPMLQLASHRNQPVPPKPVTRYFERKNTKESRLTVSTSNLRNQHQRI